MDIDPALRFGLAHFGAQHAVADARALPYPDNSIDAVATEPPYDEEALDSVAKALVEMTRVLKHGGKLTMLCALAQAEALRARSRQLALELWLDEGVDRKGLPCVLLAWRKPG
jgi:ubiquinone/menaquinone biosynthesis C-methylase UbiE